MYRFLLLACAFFIISNANASEPRIEIDTPSSAIKTYARKHVPILAGLESMSRKDTAKLLPGLLNELEDAQLRSDKIYKLFLSTLGIVKRKDFPQSDTQIELKMNLNSDLRYVFRSIAAFKKVVVQEQGFDGRISDIQLKYLVYQISSVIFQRLLEIQAMEKAGNTYFANHDDRLSNLKTAELMSMFVSNNESLYAFFENKYFIPYMETSNSVFVGAFANPDHPQPFYFISLRDDTFAAFIARREPLARALSIASICAANQFLTVHFNYLQKGWLQELRDGVFDPDSSTQKKATKKKTQNVKYPTWLLPMESTFEIIFVSAGIADADKMKAIQDIDRLAGETTKDILENFRLLNIELINISDALKKESDKNQKLEEKYAKLKERAKLQDIDLSKKTEDLKNLKQELHNSRANLDSLKKQRKSLEKDLKATTIQAQGSNAKMAQLAESLAQERKQHEESEIRRIAAETSLKKQEELTKQFQEKLELNQEALTHSRQKHSIVAVQHMQEINQVRHENEILRQKLAQFEAIQAENLNLATSLQNTQADLIAAGNIIKSYESTNTENEDDDIFIPEQYDSE